jgi:hypothetical protein
MIGLVSCSAQKLDRPAPARELHCSALFRKSLAYVCGRRHASADDAAACSWKPDPLPSVGAGLVVWIRDPEYRAPGEILRDARNPREQLELALKVG